MSNDDKSQEASAAEPVTAPDYVELRPADPNDARVLNIPRADWTAAGEPKTIEELHANRAAAAKG